MILEPALQSAIFIKRYKRFFADVELEDGSTLTLHCPNTGSMKNCLSPGAPCWYSLSDNPKRKLPGTLEMTTSPTGARVGVNTHRANKLVEEGILNGTVTELQGYQTIRREVRYGSEKSRIDLLLSGSGKDCYVEVKSVTLEQLPDNQPGTNSNHPMAFPDAVTSRGTKHIRELITMKEQGHRAVLFFCVQHNSATSVSPAWEIDPEYASTLQQAAEQGVEIIAYRCKLDKQEICLSETVPFSIKQPG